MSEEILEAVQAELSVELYVECPHCTDVFDLMNYRDLNDDGYISKQAIPAGDWSESHDKFVELLPCPHCGTSVLIKGIAW